ncbi:hypothetical protein [Thermococcus gorgonarius]|uniref:Uncharacterized protein n=1 Tax=Thermococcus gorgonarius TaxID=71997 RepID=A0A2Z2M6N3_THEGO|nr:hypothetical protein [Thermococcus gorgonarius]ASJ00889.1 hypothetical protein A3K92_05040 [Thermococcus gorgonarius]
MKVEELLSIVEETIGELKIALTANQQRAFETPYTSFEFLQRASELDEDLRDLEKLRDYLASLDPEDDLGKYFTEEELEELLRLLELLRKSRPHEY